MAQRAGELLGGWEGRRGCGVWDGVQRKSVANQHKGTVGGLDELLRRGKEEVGLGTPTCLLVHGQCSGLALCEERE